MPIYCFLLLVMATSDYLDEEHHVLTTRVQSNRKIGSGCRTWTYFPPFLTRTLNACDAMYGIVVKGNK